MTRHIPVDIDPSNLRSYRVLDTALEQIRKEVINTAADATRPMRIVLSFETHERGAK